MLSKVLYVVPQYRPSTSSLKRLLVAQGLTIGLGNVTCAHELIHLSEAAGATTAKSIGVVLDSGIIKAAAWHHGYGMLVALGTAQQTSAAAQAFDDIDFNLLGWMPAIAVLQERFPKVRNKSAAS